MDARQRTLIARHDVSRRNGNVIQYCAEQAPDIFAVLASSLRSDGALNLGTTQKSVEASIAAAMSETAGSVSRTQSLNLITQLLYRTCEAGLNGTVSSTEMTSLLRQSQRLVTSMMAIEQLTNMGRSSEPQVIAAGLASVFGDEKAGERLDTVFQNYQKAKTATTAAEAAYQSALKNGPAGATTCSAIESAIEKASCSEAKSKLDVAQASEKELREHYAALSAIARAAGVAAGRNDGASNSGNSSTVLSENSIGIIAQNVYKLAELAGSPDQVDDICALLLNSQQVESASVAFPSLWLNCREREADNAAVLVTNLPSQSSSQTNKSTSLTELNIRPGAPNQTTNDASIVGRIFIQISKDSQRRSLADLPSGLRAKFQSARIASGLDLEADNSPPTSQVRFFDAYSRNAAASVAQEVKSLLLAKGIQVNVQIEDMTNYGRTRNIAPGQLEIWIGKDVP